MVKVIIHVETEKEGSRVEKEEDFGDLSDMTEAEQSEYIEQATREIKDDMFEWGWRIAKTDGSD